MLQYAIGNVPEAFQRPTSVFVDSLQGSHAIARPDGPGYDITRASSRTSQRPAADQTSRHLTHLDSAPIASESSQPALSTLALLAANAPALTYSSSASRASTRSSTPATPASSATMSTQYAPAATPGGSGQLGPPVCANCSTSTTPLWRRDESGSVLCNACGLFLKLHGRPRPISLKTDVIKSRNRVKTSQPRKRDSTGGQDGTTHANGYPAAHPDAAALQHSHSHGLPMGMGSEHANATNGNGITHHNGAAQGYDTGSVPSDAFVSPRLPSFGLRQPSPSSGSMNGHTNMDPPQNYESLVNQNNTLRTRVSELEVINDLFRGRVAELEASEQDARQLERNKSDELQRLHSQLQAANARAAELESRLAEREAEEEPMRKKQKLDNGNVQHDDVAGAVVSVPETGSVGAA